ncbi:MAG: adenosine deaminase [Pseudomonadota bacterium]|nr:adenosine deaminase [Pseudomonadota bacterium]QKK04180.1 MAG: adenosine deaminase [Pseudomonadota bacterium]
MQVSEQFIKDMPKIELHLHIEGSLEPELMFELAQRNKIALPFPDVEAVRRAYDFSNLQDFLDIYYQGMNVLREEQDFYDLAWAYFERIAAQHVMHAEIFFDPQGHTARGIAFETVLNGLTRAMQDAEDELGVTAKLIMCFLRHLSEEDAFKTLNEALPYKDRIIGVGLDSSEKGHPPSKFANVFAKAREEGFLIVAHAGEEGPPEYVTEALDILNVDRIDHGNRLLEDAALTARIVAEGKALTVCPLSNLKLCVVKNIQDHPLKKMLDLGLKATVNSDDPAYFGGYMNENFLAVAKALDLNADHLLTLTRNGIEASFLSDAEKSILFDRVDAFAQKAAA